MSGAPGRWRRRLERAGTWWAEARDGAWSRWDARRADWVGDAAGPPGPVPPLVVTPAEDASPKRAGPGRTWLLRAVEIYFGILLLSALLLVVLALVLIPLAAVFNGVTGVWLGVELKVGPFIGVAAAILAGNGLFLSLGLAYGEQPGIGSKLAGIGITLAGMVAVFTVLGLAFGIDTWSTLLGPGIGTSLVLALLATVFELFLDRRVGAR